MFLTRMSSGGLFKQGKTYTASAGKSPLSSVRSFVPAHQPEFKTVSPVFSSSSKIRSPREKSKNDDPSPEKLNFSVTAEDFHIEMPYIIHDLNSAQYI